MRCMRDEEGKEGTNEGVKMLEKWLEIVTEKGRN